MIIYLDTSALMKRYIRERGSEEVSQLLRTASPVGTSRISKAEVAAAMAMAVRKNYISFDEAKDAWQGFQTDWRSLYKIAVSEITVDKAAMLAWEHHLGGYDAVHLASAMLWQEAIGEPVVLATFDQQLWGSGGKIGLTVWPEKI